MTRRARLDGLLAAVVLLAAAIAAGALVGARGPLAARPAVPTLSSLVSDPPSAMLLGIAVPLRG